VVRLASKNRDLSKGGFSYHLKQDSQQVATIASAPTATHGGKPGMDRPIPPAQPIKRSCSSITAARQCYKASLRGKRAPATINVNDETSRPIHPIHS